MQKFDMERFNLKVKELYQIKISNTFAALANFDDDDDVDIVRFGKV